MAKKSEKKVLVCTSRRLVCAGILVSQGKQVLADGSLDQVVIREMRVARRWNREKAFNALAGEGPDSRAEIGKVSPQPQTLYGVTYIGEITDEAWAAWQERGL